MTAFQKSSVDTVGPPLSLPVRSLHAGGGGPLLNTPRLHAGAGRGLQPGRPPAVHGSPIGGVLGLQAPGCMAVGTVKVKNNIHGNQVGAGPGLRSLFIPAHAIGSPGDKMPDLSGRQGAGREAVRGPAWGICLQTWPACLGMQPRLYFSLESAESPLLVSGAHRRRRRAPRACKWEPCLSTAWASTPACSGL